MKILVSIIIPNYNHAVFLQQRLDSVFEQTFQDFEVIILDDASKDSSLAILEKYQNHPKVSHLVINQTNSGSPFKQWQKGIALAKGEYIWIAESDDYSDLNFLEKTVEKAESTGSFGFIFTDLYFIKKNEEFQRLSEINPALKKLNDYEGAVIDSKDKISYYLFKDLLIQNVSSVLFNKNALDKIDYKKLNEFKNIGDRFVYISIALKFNCYYLNLPLNYFRIHENNTTRLNIEKGSIFLERLKMISLFTQHLSESKSSKENMVHFFNRQYLFSIRYKFYSDLITTLNKLYKYKYISLKKYTHLYLYILLHKYFKKLMPPAYRYYIKRLL